MSDGSRGACSGYRCGCASWVPGRVSPDNTFCATCGHAEGNHAARNRGKDPAPPPDLDDDDAAGLASTQDV